MHGQVLVPVLQGGRKESRVGRPGQLVVARRTEAVGALHGNTAPGRRLRQLDGTGQRLIIVRHHPTQGILQGGKGERN